MDLDRLLGGGKELIFCDPDPISKAIVLLLNVQI